MKTTYRIVLALLFMIAGAYGYFVLSSSEPVHPQISVLLQGLAIFVALSTGVIALSNSDRKAREVSVDVKTEVIRFDFAEYAKSDLPPKLAHQLDHLPDCFNAYRVRFRLTNRSGFSLKDPTLAFWLPKKRRHPHAIINGFDDEPLFHSNLFNYQDKLVFLDADDNVIISNCNLPYWNNNDTVSIWIRMVIELGSDRLFEIKFAVNAENANGKTLIAEVRP